MSNLLLHAVLMGKKTRTETLSDLVNAMKLQTRNIEITLKTQPLCFETLTSEIEKLEELRKSYLQIDLHTK